MDISRFISIKMTRLSSLFLLHVVLLDDQGEGDGKEDKEEEKATGDDERLIGYLRAISAKSVVQSLKESKKEEKTRKEKEERSNIVCY